MLALIEALGRKSAILVGHDWGASAVYSATHLAPDRSTSVVTVAIPHPRTLRPSLGALWKVRHFIAFKLPGATQRFSRDDFRQVDVLYKRWSPTWDAPRSELEAVKNAFAAPGCARAALGYYRCLKFKPDDFMKEPIRVPTLAFAGLNDLIAPEVYEQGKWMFANTYKVERLPGGHFMHRESPEQFAKALLAFLKEGINGSSSSSWGKAPDRVLTLRAHRGGGQGVAVDLKAHVNRTIRRVLRSAMNCLHLGQDGLDEIAAGTGALARFRRGRHGRGRGGCKQGLRAGLPARGAQCVRSAAAPASTTWSRSSGRKRLGILATTRPRNTSIWSIASMIDRNTPRTNSTTGEKNERTASTMVRNAPGMDSVKKPRMRWPMLTKKSPMAAEAAMYPAGDGLEEERGQGAAEGIDHALHIADGHAEDGEHGIGRGHEDAHEPAEQSSSRPRAGR